MKMESLFKKALLAPSLSLLLIGCGGAVGTPEELELPQAQVEHQESALNACEPLDEEVVEHSCYHAEYGPFASVTAAAPGSTTLPNVNLPHTAYTITLPARATSGYEGSVTYRPIESGEYAFLLSRYRALRIYDGETIVSRECSYFIDEAACSSLRRAVTADLEAGKVYRLEFKALFPVNASFTLIIEEAGHHEHE